MWSSKVDADKEKHETGLHTAGTQEQPYQRGDTHVRLQKSLGSITNRVLGEWIKLIRDNNPNILQQLKLTCDLKKKKKWRGLVYKMRKLGKFKQSTSRFKNDKIISRWRVGSSDKEITENWVWNTVQGFESRSWRKGNVSSMISDIQIPVLHQHPIKMAGKFLLFLYGSLLQLFQAVQNNSAE